MDSMSEFRFRYLLWLPKWCCQWAGKCRLYSLKMGSVFWKNIFSQSQKCKILPIHDDSSPVNLSVSFLLYSFELPLNAAFTIPINDMHWPNWKISIILTDAAKNWKLWTETMKFNDQIIIYTSFDLFEILVRDSAEIDNHRCHIPVVRSNSA